MSEQFESKLPVYAVSRSTDFPVYLVVTCGYDDCPGTVGGRVFLVAEKEWLRPIRRVARTTKRPFVITGRSCPYCFRAGRLPRRRDIK